MLEAVEQTVAMRAGGAAPEPTKEMSEEALARQNALAMRELQKQMGGLGT